jgi:hypothetical protein
MTRAFMKPRKQTTPFHTKKETDDTEDGDGWDDGSRVGGHPRPPEMHDAGISGTASRFMKKDIKKSVAVAPHTKQRRTRPSL